MSCLSGQERQNSNPNYMAYWCWAHLKRKIPGCKLEHDCKNCQGGHRSDSRTHPGKYPRQELGLALDMVVSQLEKRGCSFQTSSFSLMLHYYHKYNSVCLYWIRQLSLAFWKPLNTPSAVWDPSLEVPHLQGSASFKLRVNMLFHHYSWKTRAHSATRGQVSFATCILQYKKSIVGPPPAYEQSPSPTYFLGFLPMSDGSQQPVFTVPYPHKYYSPSASTDINSLGAISFQSCWNNHFNLLQSTTW